ncbi:hypothetical protein Daus18300_007636 [Diaporthe australafricana]|uniref:Phosphotransferase family protein n=1 Tax=Diaporthe australafricana TaxID=127596 RepID=A0ABR3WM69_9PEZI
MRDKDRGLFIDSLLCNRNAELAHEWLDFAGNRNNVEKLVDFARRYRPGFSLPKIIHTAIRGSYNVNWRLEFEDGLSTIIHVPIPHTVAFPDEKIRAEVATMRLIRNNTTIPVPEVYGWGTSAGNPTGYGPFIVMEYIEHTRSLQDVIRDRIDSVGSTGLKKGVPDKKLLKAYRQMANIMLQLSTIEGTAIGYPSLSKPLATKPPASSSSSSSAPLQSTSPSPNAPISFDSTNQSKSRISKVHHRPVSMSMNDLVIMGGLPPSILPPSNKAYTTSDEYYQAMADLHLAHLTFQHNDAVEGRPDGSEKYVARQLFRRLAKEGQLAKDEDECEVTAAGTQQKEVFKLWCDDMRPSSVLLDGDDNVVGVIDWEMSYFAPASYHYDPPWWLLKEKPEFYKKGLGSWAKEYERRLPLYLEAVDMEEAHLKAAKEHTNVDAGPVNSRLQLLTITEAGRDAHPSTPTSKRMKRNWESGRFFVDYAARRNYAFDPIYWKYIDKKFFGKNKKAGLLSKKSAYKERLHLLSEQERAQMERFVAWKSEDVEGEEVVEWDENDAQAVMAACLAVILD